LYPTKGPKLFAHFVNPGLSCVFGHVCYWCKKPNNYNKQLFVCVFLIFIFVGVLSCVLFLPLLQSENKIIIIIIEIGKEFFKNLE